MSKKLIPVIHVITEEDTYLNIELCLKNEINNIMLISHGYFNFEKIINLYIKLKNDYPILNLGINFLDLKNTNIFQILKNYNFYPDMLWIDNCFKNIDYSLNETITFHNNYQNYIENGFKGLFFCGFAFKYQKQPKNLELSTKKILPIINGILTTSGEETGTASNLNKIITIFNILKNDNLKICLASGININNIDIFINYIDYFLVSTGINNQKNILIEEEKLIQLKNKIY